MKTPLLLSAVALLAGCPTATYPGYTDIPVAEPGGPMPEGETTWEGTIEVAGFDFLATATITNTGGDLEVALAFEDDPANPSGLGSGELALSGTHDPRAGLVGVAPSGWIVENPNSELLGFYGSYDPASQTLRGTIVDGASPSENSFRGGPATFALLSGDGAPTAVGDGAQALDGSTAHFEGTFQCASAVRPIEGELTYHGDGRVSGWNTWAETDLAEPVGTHDLFGVHNPDTGSLTLLPSVWHDDSLEGHNYATNWVDGTYDADQRDIVATTRTTRTICLDDQFLVALD